MEQNIQFHGQTKYQVGDYVEIIIGADANGYITNLYQIIQIHNSYPKIKYIIKRDNYIKIITDDEIYNNFQQINLRIGSIISVKDNDNFKDGIITEKIIKDNNIKYIVKFIDNTFMEFDKKSLHHPIGYFIQ